MDKSAKSNTDTITFDVTSAQVVESFEKRAKTHETASAEWLKRAEDKVWCQRTAMANAATLRRQATQQGTAPDKIPDADGIAEFATTKSKENLEAVRYARMMRDAVTPNRIFSLSQEDYLNLVGDITSKVSPFDPPAEKAEKGSSPAS